jgi:hypothetical protein
VDGKEGVRFLDADFNMDGTELPEGVFTGVVVWRQEARLVSSIQEGKSFCSHIPNRTGSLF